jgi:FKBP-type peptidyl-prolyl cis-trans isomerase SlyD
MQATQNTVVKISYQLRNEPTGGIVDEATEDAPFSFLFGHQNVLPKFEEYLQGKVAGNQFHFVLSPEDGYGVFEESGVVQLSKDMFMHEGVLQEDVLTIGNVIPLQDQDGNPFQGRVVGVENEAVVIDLNHPLAGKELHFSGVVLEVREAHPVEIEHGHVHEGGNHHH